MSENYEERVRSFIRQNHIQAEQLIFGQSCHSVAEAARAVNAAPDDLVKNICLIGERSEFIVAIVRGTHRVSTRRVGTVLEIAPPRLATPEEILERTGFPCGGTPSFGYRALFLMDPKIFESEIVYTGGGSETALIRITPQELQRANQGQVFRIRK